MRDWNGSARRVGGYTDRCHRVATRVEDVDCPSVGPFTLAVTPDGKTLYVTGGANLLTPIRTSTNHSGTPIVVGERPSAIAFAILRRQQ
jgi:DNA-binding beta-propeller fold protein YncE